MNERGGYPLDGPRPGLKPSRLFRRNGTWRSLPSSPASFAPEPSPLHHREETDMIALVVNGQKHEVDAPPDTPLLWVLRDTLGLTGTKYGCGLAVCGACTVHVNGNPMRSCVLPVSAVVGSRITTIETANHRIVQALQRAWVEREVSQCGYCQPGQILSAAALLAGNPRPADADIDAALSGNLCRCATYARIRAAVHDAAKALGA
jgi:aerobic-type carbon monoxide dehydrogenase small subunit (CoxS/CutS family)